MEVPVFDLFHMVEIELHDRDTINNQMLGHASVQLKLFCLPGGMQEWIELFNYGQPAGRIHLRSEYMPEMGGGMVNGMGNQVVIQ